MSEREVKYIDGVRVLDHEGGTRFYHKHMSAKAKRKKRKKRKAARKARRRK